MKKFIVKLAVGAALVVTLGGSLASAGVSSFNLTGGGDGGTGAAGSHGFIRNTATNATFWSHHPTRAHRPAAIINGRVHAAPGGLAAPRVTRNYVRPIPSGAALGSSILHN